MRSKSKPIFDVLAVVTGMLERRITVDDFNQLTEMQKRQVQLELTLHYLGEQNRSDLSKMLARGHRSLDTSESICEWQGKA